jgi:hypothetical protein
MMTLETEKELIDIDVRWAVVGYCDVRDFMSWIQVASDMNRDVRDFLRKMKWAFRKFRLATGYHALPIGDGIIAVLDAAPASTPVNVFRFVNSLAALEDGLCDIADEEIEPRPGHSRIRITAGSVYRIEEPPPTLIDFIGKPMNLGSRLLHVRREIPALITNVAREAMTAEEQSNFIFTPIELVGRLPRGVTPEDVKGLCAFKSMKD